MNKEPSEDNKKYIPTSWIVDYMTQKYNVTEKRVLEILRVWSEVDEIENFCAMYGRKGERNPMEEENE